MKKTLAILTVILIIVLGPALWLNTRTGVTIHDQFLFRRASGEYRSLSGWSIVYDEAENTFLAVLGKQTFHAKAVLDDNFARFTFSDGTIAEGWLDSRFGLVDSNGVPMTFSDDIEIIVGDENLRLYLTPCAVACEFCRIAMDAAEPYGSIAIVLLGSMIYLLGAAQFIWPEQMFFLFSRWRYQKAELSDDGILAEKASAILLMICAAAVMFAPLFA